ncbi:MAG TPA: AbrB/MazE/SpoVT family DNA-binding domain-containing protein [Bacteroides sp.]|jgi:antitoxin MazE|nr:AbrB/MazE/SpoVT family DNA-binding domain-containing protein [Bacteroides sp.]
MKAQIQKWGNSLALRIPKSFAEETNIKNGSYVNLSLVRGNLVARPLPGEEYSLKELLSNINEDNIHKEFDTGDAAGNEVW